MRLIALLFLLWAAVPAWADIPFLWLDRPQGRSNPHDPAFLGPSAAVPTPVPTPALKHPFVRRYYLNFVTPDSLAVDEAANSAYLADAGHINCPVLDLASGNDLRQFNSYASYPAGSLTSTEDMSLAPNGDRYICTGYNRVGRLDANENFLNWIGGPVGFGNGQFNSPVDTCVDALNNRVVVADRYNDLIQVLGTDGSFLFQFGGSGSGAGQFSDLCAVKVDAGGNIYAADSGRDDVQVFNSAGTFLRKVDGGLTQGGAFSDLRDMDLGPSDDLYVLERDRLVVFDNAGNSRYAQAGNLWPQDFAPGVALEVGPSGKVYISSDASGGQLVVFGPATP